MCLSHHLECAASAGTSSHHQELNSLICRVEKENYTGNEWPGFTHEDLTVLGHQRSGNLLKIACHYNSACNELDDQKYGLADEKLEMTRQEQDQNQAQRNQAPKFVSAVQPKPQTSFAQVQTEVKVFRNLQLAPSILSQSFLTRNYRAPSRTSTSP